MTMKKIVLIVFLLQAVGMMAEKPKPNPADYTLTVHVIGSQGEGEAMYQHLEVVIDGQQVMLQGSGRGVLALGDYKAKLTGGVNPIKPANDHDRFEGYEFLFADGTTRYYEVVGFGVLLPDSAASAANP